VEQPTANMPGKICLVTGATSGIGLVSARELASQGTHVVLVGRSREKCDKAVQQIQAQTGNRNVDFLLADLSSQQQIRELARLFRERYGSLDVLVNNAGGIWMQRQETIDGLEMTFAVNHLAYFQLTLTLLDLLKASAPSRVVNVASRAHAGATLDFDDLQGQHRYGGWRAYCRSKLANLLFTYELARQLARTGVTANALHPGFVATGFGTNNGWRALLLRVWARLAAISAEEAARTVVYLATSPEVAGVSGQYVFKQKAVASSPASHDEAAAKRLWQMSLEMLRLPPETEQSERRKDDR
jgi:retinol dehydrogenase-12